MQNNMFHVNRPPFWPGNNAKETQLEFWPPDTLILGDRDKGIQFSELLYGEILSAY